MLKCIHYLGVLEKKRGGYFRLKAFNKLGYQAKCADLHLKGLRYSKIRNSGYAYYQFNLCDPLFAEHKKRYSTKELKEKVESTGFKVLKLSYFTTFLFPFISSSRMLSSFLSYINLDNINSKVRVFRELEVNPVLNSLFYLIFRIEAKFILLFYFPLEMATTDLNKSLQKIQNTTDSRQMQINWRFLYEEWKYIKYIHSKV